MNDANKETNTAYEEPKKKVYVKLIIFLALITAMFIVLGAKFVSFYYKTHGIGGRYFYKGCDAEVVHQLPEGLTDEDISNAVIMDKYDNGFDHEYTTAGESDFFVETHYLLGVQNIDNKNCKVYLLSDCGHYKDSVLQSGSLVVKMIDFESRKVNGWVIICGSREAEQCMKARSGKLSPLSWPILYSAMRKQRSKRRSSLKRKKRSRRTIILTKWRNINFV